MIDSWNDCVVKWLRAGMGGNDSFKLADAWEAAHREVDLCTEQKMAEYQAGALLAASQANRGVK